jgi:hypothetical protein
MEKPPCIMSPENEEQRCADLKRLFYEKRQRSGASTDEASTVLPGSEDDDAMSNGSDLSVGETHPGKSSTSRTVLSRGSGRAKKMARRAQKHYEAMGRKSFSTEENKLRQQQAALQAMVDPTGQVPPEERARQTHNEFISTMKSLGDIDKADFVQNFLNLMEPIAMKEGSNFGRELVATGFFAKALSYMLHGDMCIPCGKFADEAHINCKQHIVIQEVIAGCNYMLGSSTERVYAQGLKLAKGQPLTKVAVYTYWGADIENFSQRLQHRAAGVPTIQLNTARGKKKTHEVPSKYLKAGQVLMVPYRAGIGKYKNFASKHGKNLRPVPFAGLPDGYSGSMVDDISGDLARISQVGQDHHQQFDWDDADELTYWPLVQWVPTADLPAEYAWLFTTAGVVWVTCIIQAMTEIIVAWEVVDVFYEMFVAE